MKNKEKGCHFEGGTTEKSPRHRILAQEISHAYASASQRFEMTEWCPEGDLQTLPPFHLSTSGNMN